MFWVLFFVIVAIAFLKLPAFRKTILVITIVLVASIVGYVLYDRHEIEVSKTLVKPEQLEFSALRFGVGSFGSTYKLTGRAKNTSRYAVFAIRAKILALDCDDKANCEVVGEAEQVLSLFIPPGQARDIAETVYFANGMHVRGHFQWSHVITEIRARAD